MITHVHCTKAFHIPTVGTMSQSTFSQQFYSGIEMVEHKYGVMATFRGNQFLIPWNMVQCVVYAPTSKEQPIPKIANAK